MDLPDVISPDGVAPEPWANGGGLTRVLHHTPQLRVSVATITGSGPFSTFAGWDRLFVPLGPADVELTISGAVQTVKPGSAIQFRGEETVEASVADGTALVVNVMVSRGLATLRYQIVSGPFTEPGRGSSILNTALPRGRHESLTIAGPRPENAARTDIVVLTGAVSISGIALVPGSLVTGAAIRLLDAGENAQLLAVTI